MANEKRLIDANALKARFKLRIDWLARDAHDEYTTGLFHGAETDVELIDEIPTVDAVEVVHGRWEDMYDGKYANPRYMCSVCKERSLYTFVRGFWGGWKEMQALTDYCPNCGAKMDGDGNG